jgi:uncharacterized membrane protein
LGRDGVAVGSGCGPGAPAIARGVTVRERSIEEVTSTERQALGEFAREDPLWPGQLALAAIITLSLVLPEKLTFGPRWLMPAVEAVGLMGLIAATPRRNPQYSRRQRIYSLALVALVSATYLVSLWLLVHYLVKGGKANGHPLISAGVVLWVDNVLLFAIWYWLLDRDGPLPREEADVRPVFMFTQMTEDGHELYPDWSPNFFDYLYLSLTNASAFSPTDTLPLTRQAKLTMAIQSVASLVTVGVVLARAVNILS